MGLATFVLGNDGSYACDWGSAIQGVVETEEESRQFIVVGAGSASIRIIRRQRGEWLVNMSVLVKGPNGMSPELKKSGDTVSVWAPGLMGVYEVISP